MGRTGVGKSKPHNELIRCDEIKNGSIFTSSADTQSCTKKVESSTFQRVRFNVDNNKIINFELKVFDTPGMGDSKDRSKEFLNEIAQILKIEPLNLIIMLVEYGKLDTSFCNNLEVLRECLSDSCQSS